MTKTEYAILRALKIKDFNELSALAAHWLRQKHTPNSNPARRKYNRVLHGSRCPKLGVENMLRKKEITKLRKNGVLAIEFMLAFSPEYIVDEEGQYKPDAKQKLKAWLEESKNWLINEFGENCISVIAHFDETSPHIHAVILPVKQWVNKKGDKLNKLCAREITGGAAKLSKLQDSYAEHLQENGVNLNRGLKNSKAKHQTLKQFYTAINESKKECMEAGIAPPPKKPEQFNAWRNTINKLVSSIQKDRETDVEKLTEFISELVMTNKRLEALLENNRISRKLSR